MEILNKISNDTSKKEIVDAVNEAVQVRWQMDEAKQSIKEIAEAIKDKYEIKPAEFIKVVETVYKNNLEEQREKLDALEKVVDIIAKES